MPKIFRVAFMAVLVASPSVKIAAAHGIVGDRFFPPTITTDDPFAVDEFAFPTVSYFKNPPDTGSPAIRQLDAGFEFDKEILPRFAVGISDNHISEQPVGAHWINGWDSLTITAKYELWQNDVHEAIASVGLESDIGGTGTRRTGADSYTTFTPSLYLGKGLGGLPDNLSALKPFAVTTDLGQTFPTRSQNPNTFQWGFAVEYSLPYFQQHVTDVGLSSPLKNLIPLLEFSLQTTENRGQNGLTTGTINPGILWETRYAQIGAEAVIPINHRSGANVGVIIQMWIFIDDLFPRLFGYPVFSGESHE